MPWRGFWIILLNQWSDYILYKIVDRSKPSCQNRRAAERLGARLQTPFLGVSSQSLNGRACAASFFVPAVAPPARDVENAPVDAVFVENARGFPQSLGL
jgi:hypothetical protein